MIDEKVEIQSQKKKVKKTLLTIVLLWVVLILWISFYDIIINEDIFIYQWSTYLTFLLTLLTLYSLLKQNSAINKEIKKQRKNIFLTFIVFILAVPFLSKITFERGLPALLHHITKTPSTMSVKIEEKISYRNCRKGVLLIGYEYFANGKVCGLSDEVLSQIDYNDTLELIGEKSIFGFTYHSYKFIKYVPTKVSKNLMLPKQQIVDLDEIERYLDGTL